MKSLSYPVIWWCFVYNGAAPSAGCYCTKRLNIQRLQGRFSWPKVRRTTAFSSWFLHNIIAMIHEETFILLGKGFQTKNCLKRVPVSHRERNIGAKLWKRPGRNTELPQLRFSALFRRLYKLACHLLMSNWEDEELLARAVKWCCVCLDYKGMWVLKTGSSTLPDHIFHICFLL